MRAMECEKSHPITRMCAPDLAPSTLCTNKIKNLQLDYRPFFCILTTNVSPIISELTLAGSASSGRGTVLEKEL